MEMVAVIIGHEVGALLLVGQGLIAVLSLGKQVLMGGKLSVNRIHLRT